MTEIGTRLRFKGEPHPDTGEPRHLGQDGVLHVMAGQVDADGNGVGDGSHLLRIGTVGTVVAHVPAEVDGAGTHEADCTVLVFPQESAALVDGEAVKVTSGVRHISFEDHQLDAWFEGAE